METKLVVESRFEEVRTALETGDTETAASVLQTISAEIPEVRGEEGQPQLVQEQEFLAAKLADTSPGEPADLSTPPKSKPSALSTDIGRPAVAVVGPRVQLVVGVGGFGRPVAVEAGRPGRPA